MIYRRTMRIPACWMLYDNDLVGCAVYSFILTHPSRNPLTIPHSSLTFVHCVRLLISTEVNILIRTHITPPSKYVNTRKDSLKLMKSVYTFIVKHMEG